MTKGGHAERGILKRYIVQNVVGQKLHIYPCVFLTLGDRGKGNDVIGAAATRKNDRYKQQCKYQSKVFLYTKYTQKTHNNNLADR